LIETELQFHPAQILCSSGEDLFILYLRIPFLLALHDSSGRASHPQASKQAQVSISKVAIGASHSGSRLKAMFVAEEKRVTRTYLQAERFIQI
jgi:hypothetical protein